MARKVSEALGSAWNLPHHATINEVIIEAEKVTVNLTVFEVEETVREDRFKRKGMRLLEWTSSPDSLFGWKYQTITLWDESFVPYAEHKVGRIESVKEYMDRRKWEGEVYRPGSERSPMDSAYRVTLGHTTTQMERYWNN
jgi:hypothetical protein